MPIYTYIAYHLCVACIIVIRKRNSILHLLLIITCFIQIVQHYTLLLLLYCYILWYGLAIICASFLVAKLMLYIFL